MMDGSWVADWVWSLVAAKASKLEWKTAHLRDNSKDFWRVLQSGHAQAVYLAIHAAA